MSFVVRAPKGMLERKPAHGQPCNRCGLCCSVALCDLGKHMFAGGTPDMVAGPCPALVREADGGYTCGLTQGPHKARAEAAALLITVGVGCTMKLFGERDVAFDQALDERDHANVAERAAARKLWGM